MKRRTRAGSSLKRWRVWVQRVRLTAGCGGRGSGATWARPGMFPSHGGGVAGDEAPAPAGVTTIGTKAKSIASVAVITVRLFIEALSLRSRWSMLRRAASGGLVARRVTPGSRRGHWRGFRRMEFRILGPLEVVDDNGAGVAVGGSRERAVLALLLLSANRVVSSE